MQLTLVSTRIEQIICTTYIEQKSVIKRLQSSDVFLFPEPILWFYTLLLLSSSYPTIVLCERYQCSSFLPFEIILKTEIFVFNLSEHLNHLMLQCFLTKSQNISFSN